MNCHLLLTRGRPASGRGFTMIEMMFAVAISTICGVLTISAFTYTLRISKAQRFDVNLANDSMKFQSVMKQFGMTAQRFNLINPQGTSLQIVQPGPNGTAGATSAMNYSNGDGNDSTLSDNVLAWDPNSATGVTGDDEILIKGIYPLDANTPVFAYVPSTSALRVRFRIGDHTATNANDNARSGTGYQAYVVDTVFCPRNN